MTLSIIGCVVNGPGEALMTDLGFTGGGKDAGMVYVAGKPDHKIDNDDMVDHIVGLVEARAAILRAAELLPRPPSRASANLPARATSPPPGEGPCCSNLSIIEGQRRIAGSSP